MPTLCHWQHRRLSLWQPQVLPVMTKLTPWKLWCFSAIYTHLGPWGLRRAKGPRLSPILCAAPGSPLIILFKIPIPGDIRSCGMCSCGASSICAGRLRPRWPRRPDRSILIPDSIFLEWQFMHMGWSDLFTRILQGCFTGTGAIIWLPHCQWGNP